MPPITAGWKEYADFPDWDLRRVKVKLDTGARTAAVGVLRYELISGPEAGEVARGEEGEHVPAVGARRRRRLVGLAFLEQHAAAADLLLPQRLAGVRIDAQQDQRLAVAGSRTGNLDHLAPGGAAEIKDRAYAAVGFRFC